MEKSYGAQRILQQQKENKENSLKQVEALRTRLTQLIQEKPVSSISETVPELSAQDWEKRAQRAGEQAKKLQKELDRNKKAQLYEKKRVQELKAELSTIKQDKNQLRNDLKSTQTELQSQQSQINRLTAELEDVDVSHFKAQINELRLENAALHNKNYTLRRTLHKVQERLKENRIELRKNDNREILERNMELVEKNYNLQISLATLNEENQHFQTQLAAATANLDISTLIRLLELRLDSEELNQKHLFQLKTIVEKIEKQSCVKAYKKKILERIAPSIISQNMAYGYLIKNEDELFSFCSIEGEIFTSVQKIPSLYGELESDMPVKVYLEEDTAIVTQIYQDCELNSVVPEYKHRKRQWRAKINDIMIQSPESYKILIIGSRNKTLYLQTLKENQLMPIWHDPYEESDDRLKARYQSADIVIVCKEHIPHRVYGSVDKSDPKVEILGRDNPQTLLYRVRYALLKLGLMQSGKTDEIAK